jgi:aspartyl-tRNA(Asn)/glutamyl-tRNA(Gln) amidotransferase subunit A
MIQAMIPSTHPPSVASPTGSSHRFAPLPPIAQLRQRLAQGLTTHEALLDQVLARADSAAAAGVWTQRLDAGAREAARHADALQRLGAPLPPLAGLPVTVKDLFDVAGTVTTAGSRLLADAPPAAHDAPAVARLRGAGAALLGKTHMTEFAFSGVGLNPHHPTPANPWDTLTPRIPGGSSSGAAVSVALGLAVAGLGSDTGGSIRIPAALCGLVGFKCTQARVPREGAFPLSTTLDTVCAMARGVADVLQVDAVLAGAPLAVAHRPLAGRRLLVPRTLMLDGLEPAVASAFERALGVLSAQGALIVEAALEELGEIAGINSPGGFSAVEAYAVHRQAMATRRGEFDPRVAARIALGEPVGAADYLRMVRRRSEWIARMNVALQGFDAVVAPTVPLVAPPMADLRASDDAFFAANARLLRNTFAVNFLDGCAFSLPCQTPGELPVGLMLAAPAHSDAALASVALAAEAALTQAGMGSWVP